MYGSNEIYHEVSLSLINVPHRIHSELYTDVTGCNWTNTCRRESIYFSRLARKLARYVTFKWRFILPSTPCGRIGTNDCFINKREIKVQCNTVNRLRWKLHYPQTTLMKYETIEVLIYGILIATAFWELIYCLGIVFHRFYIMRLLSFWKLSFFWRILSFKNWPVENLNFSRLVFKWLHLFGNLFYFLRLIVLLVILINGKNTCLV